MHARRRAQGRKRGILDAVEHQRNYARLRHPPAESAEGAPMGGGLSCALPARFWRPARLLGGGRRWEGLQQRRLEWRVGARRTAEATPKSRVDCTRRWLYAEPSRAPSGPPPRAGWRRLYRKIIISKCDMRHSSTRSQKHWRKEADAPRNKRRNARRNHSGCLHC